MKTKKRPVAKTVSKPAVAIEAKTEPTPPQRMIPTLILCADMPRGTQALIAALSALGKKDEDLVRAFELYEEEHCGNA